MSQSARSKPRVLAYDVVSALGHGVDAHHRAFVEGRSGIVLDESFGVRASLGRIATLDEPDRVPTPAARSRAARILVRLAPSIREAVATSRFERSRIGVIVGTSTGGLDRTELFLAGAIGPDEFDRDSDHAVASLADVVAEAIGVEGPRLAVSTACTSGAKTFALARRWLALGIVDAVVVGAADGLCGTTVRGFHSLQVLAEERSRPFAANAVGMNVGEGGALVLLACDEEPGVRLVGYGETSDAHHVASPEPQGRGAEAAIRIALADAGLATVDYVNAHGTGTALNDAAESLALHRTLGLGPVVSSTKGATGHLLGASGALEAMFAVMAIERGFVPPSLGAEPSSFSASIRIARDGEAREVRTAVSTSLAFGGSNTAVVFAQTGAS